MLTVRDIAELPDLGLAVAAGAAGLDNPVTWLHVSELVDPTQFLEGGEFLLTTGIGIGDEAGPRAAYIRRLADHGLAGLGFGVGLGHSEIPRALADEADARGFPILCVPYEVPFVAITKAAVARLASEQLDRLTRALAVHERLADAVLEERGADALLGIVCNHLDCSLALVDDDGRVVSERHSGRTLGFDDALELPVAAPGEHAVLRAARSAGEFGEYDRLVLHHGQTALAFELSRRRAVSAAELRLAGDLLDDLEHERLDDGEVARRFSAFGLEAQTPYAALVAIPVDGVSAEVVRAAVARELEARDVPYLSTARRDRAAFLVAADDGDSAVALAAAVAEAETGARVGVGRPTRGRRVGRSLLEARAALGATTRRVASYHDLGSLELLLSLPDAALEAFVERVLGEAARQPRLVESLTTLLDAGCRWSDAAERMGVHRHTLRYRMDRVRDRTGRHPDDPEQRMELWLAVKALQALAARGGERAA